MLKGLPDCPVGKILLLFSTSEKSITLLVDGPDVTGYLPVPSYEKDILLITSRVPEIGKGPTLKKNLRVLTFPIGCPCSKVCTLFQVQNFLSGPNSDSRERTAILKAWFTRSFLVSTISLVPISSHHTDVSFFAMGAIIRLWKWVFSSCWNISGPSS